MSQHKQTNDSLLPWYQHFWPWVVISIPALTIIAGVTTFYLASQSQDSLVADNYYKEGLAINQRLDRIRTAQQLGLNADLLITNEIVDIRLSGKLNTWPKAVKLTLLHPTLNKQDRFIELKRKGSKSHYTANLALPISGNWNIRLSSPDDAWQLSAAFVLPMQNRQLIKAQP